MCFNWNDFSDLLEFLSLKINYITRLKQARDSYTIMCYINSKLINFSNNT